tara:strand:+ start:259 stop:399 length:141 start_codon:yes stop_codon:yes gene_type:complete
MHLEIKIKKTKKDHYKLTFVSKDNTFTGEFERSEIRNIIGVLDNEI